MTLHASGVDKATLSSNPPSSTDTISPSSLKSPLSPTVKTLSPLPKGSGSNSPGKLLSPTTKTSTRKNSSGSSDSSSRPKVSFKDKIMKLQEDGTSVTQPLVSEVDDNDKKLKLSDKVPIVLKSDKQQPSQTDGKTISIPASVVNKIKSPVKAVGSTFKDKLKLLQGAPPISQKDTPVTNLVPDKLETSVKNVNSDVKSVQQPETKDDAKESKKPWSKLKKAAILSESQDELPSGTSCSPKEKVFPIESAKKTALPKLELEDTSHSPVTSYDTIMPSHSGITSDNNNVDIDNMNVSNLENASTHSSKYETISKESINVKSYATTSDPEAGQSQKQSDTKNVIKPAQNSVRLTRKNKSYVSVEDLSPEYGMLPFVKKLKILNERQKLAELEKEVKKARSSSLDCADTIMERDVLTRSNSEGSSVGRHSFGSNQTDLPYNQCLDQSQNPLSPESNETLERQNLKSILKKLSEDAQNQEPPHFKRLIRAPTIEGYAARHSKFAKSVTFNRDTLTSPPNSATESKTLFPLSTPYHRLASVQSSDSIEKYDADDTWICDEQSDASTPNSIPRRDSDPLDIGSSTLIKDLIEKRTSELETSLDPKFRYASSAIEGLRPEEIRVPSEKPKLHLISAVANQRKLLRGL